MDTLKVYAVKCVETTWEETEEVYWYCWAAKAFVNEPAQKYTLNPFKAQKVIDKNTDRIFGTYSIVTRTSKLEEAYYD